MMVDMFIWFDSKAALVWFKKNTLSTNMSKYHRQINDLNIFTIWPPKMAKLVHQLQKLWLFILPTTANGLHKPYIAKKNYRYKRKKSAFATHVFPSRFSWVPVMLRRLPFGPSVGVDLWPGAPSAGRGRLTLQVPRRVGYITGWWLTYPPEKY